MKYLSKYILLLTIISFLSESCNDNYISSIPYFPVSLELNLSVSPYTLFRNSTNKYLLFEKQITGSDLVGYAGILVYTGVGFDDLGNSNYYAFDMSCPYEHQIDVRVRPDLNGLGRVVCEKCGSVFDVSYGVGNPVSGKAKEVLKRYKTSLSGYILYISR